ncbi:hypothetical protein M0R45_030061 [Rubus argutus]|uniref:Uncharacterized protein n=1 Tax=Rubus argutus TaxID=59490 RepID=A0AAW1WA56_RUBAR
MAPTIEELKGNYVKLGSINEKQEKTVRYLESMTIKLVIAYIFFQVLIFMSISQQHPAKNFSCKNWWIPSCLSSLVALVFAITFKTFVTKWERTQYYYDMNFMERDMIHQKMQVMLMHNNQQQQQESKVLKCDMVKVYQRYAFIYLVSIALLAYTILILKACRSILCHTSE